MRLSSRLPPPGYLAGGRSFGQVFEALSDGCPLPAGDREAAHFAELDAWLSDDPAGYGRWIERLAGTLLRTQLSSDCLRWLTAAFLTALREANLAAFACGEALQICLADLALIEELGEAGLPPRDLLALREQLMPASADLVHRLLRNMAVRARVARFGPGASLEGPAVRLADRVTSEAVDLGRHDPGRPVLIVLTAGRGTRLRSTIPKGLIPVAGVPMIERVVRAARAAGITQTIFVLKYRAEVQAGYLSRFGAVQVQGEAQGTGHSAITALAALAGQHGTVVLSYSDAPFLAADSFRRVLEPPPDADGVLRLSTFTPAEGNSGRVVRDGRGRVLRIEQPRLGHSARSDEGDGGLYGFRHEPALRSLAKITNANPRREYQFTDLVGQLTADGFPVRAIRGPREDFQGVNAPSDLVLARLRAATGTERDPHWRRSVASRDALAFFAAYGASDGAPASGVAKMIEKAEALVGPVLDLGVHGG